MSTATKKTKRAHTLNETTNHEREYYIGEKGYELRKPKQQRKINIIMKTLAAHNNNRTKHQQKFKFGTTAKKNHTPEMHKQTNR